MVGWLVTQHVDLNAPARLWCKCSSIDNFDYDVEYDDDTRPMWTPVHFAICKHHTSIARLLLAASGSTRIMVDPRSGLEVNLVDDRFNLVVHDGGPSNDLES
ncbi:ankyrin-like protein [Colletotrichum acutatum]